MSSLMDYRGYSITVAGGNTPTPTPVTGYMKYKGNWDTTVNYSINDYVTYNRISYIALKDSQGSQPDTNPTNWQVVSYWSNVNNVSNFRGDFATNTIIQQYDSIRDPNTNIIYTWLEERLYTTTFLADMIQNFKVLGSSATLPLQNSTPCFFGYTGNGTDIESGALLFPQTGQPDSIIQSDIQINTPVISQMFSFRNNNTVMTLNPIFTEAKEGLYKISATFLMWIYQNQQGNQPPNDIFNNFGGGYFEIAKLIGGTTRSGIVRNRCGTYKACSTDQFRFYYPTSMTLECIVPLKFYDAIVLNCTNVSLQDYGFAIVPTLNVIYLGPQTVVF
jgi:hypothetical protein